MTFPLAQTVGVHSCTEAVVLDDYGDLGPVFTPARDQPGTTVRVYGWYVPSSTEPAVVGHERIVIDVQLFVPPDFPVGPYDLVDLPSGQFQVIGEPEDLNHGPFGFAPGLVVNLRKVTG